MSEAQTRITAELRRSLGDLTLAIETREEHNEYALIVLQRGERSVGVDETGGLWVRMRHDGKWFSLARESNPDSLGLAAGFLITEDASDQSEVY